MIGAADIGTKISTEGRVAVYAINFDFDKAEVRADSEPQLAEIAKFLKSGTAKVYIVGHTDGRGGLDYNVSLSQRRAEAVARTLATKYKIDPKRLTSRGLGPLAPLASNRSEDGQSKNRRVEIVEQ
jgi:outer membrane protein OmpA-like peptidoglycan-associated protein